MPTRPGRQPINDAAGLCYMRASLQAAEARGDATNVRAAARDARLVLDLPGASPEAIEDRLRHKYSQWARAGFEISPNNSRASEGESADVSSQDSEEQAMLMSKDRDDEAQPQHRRLEDFAEYVAARDQLRETRRDLNTKTDELKRLRLARSRQFMASEVEQIETAKALYLAGEPIPDLRTIDEAIARLEHEADVVGAVFRDRAAIVAELKAAAETEIIGEARPRHRRLVIDVKHAVEQLMAAVAAEAAFRATLERDGVQVAALRAVLNLLPSAVTGQGFNAPLTTFLRDVGRQLEN